MAALIFYKYGPQSEHAHSNGRYACVVAYRRQWKGDAAVALYSIGISMATRHVAEIEVPAVRLENTKR